MLGDMYLTSTVTTVLVISVLHSADYLSLVLVTKQNLHLTFRGPCIVVYSYNKSQRDAQFLRFI